MEGRRVRPASDGQEDLEVAVLLLQLVDGLEVAVQVLARVAPRVPGVMDLLVRPGVREEDLAAVGPYVCKCIEDVPGGFRAMSKR